MQTLSDLRGRAPRLSPQRFLRPLSPYRSAVSLCSTWIVVGVLLAGRLSAAPPIQVGGIYPHLAMFNDEDECGTGAVVPWAGRLWAVTYAPHKPTGSTDKLYEITPDLEQIVRPESIGGTPANRMIHRESAQLFIGPYVIDAERRVRVIPFDTMFGRPTGNARHLADPESRVYCATMEEGLYEVDVRTLQVTESWADEQKPEGRHANLPGYHGKGLYSGQGRLIYANNGEHGAEALRNPALASGVLAEWDGAAPAWTVIRRGQFTDVTGPGGLEGNAYAALDPVWSIGWDHRSLILMALDKGKWHAYRLPKTSHCYDGAHGWNTEWPRIRDIGETDLLMTMHGSFWKFPRRFSASQSAGIAPRGSHLKVIGDFCRWNDRLVFGCDDSARSGFLNRRKAKGSLAGPGQSQSNLWFTDPNLPDRLGPVLGRGAVWLQDSVEGGQASDPYLFSGSPSSGPADKVRDKVRGNLQPYAHRALHITHAGDEPVTFTVEVDQRGDGTWKMLRSLEVPPRGYAWTGFAPEETGCWVRLKPNRSVIGVTAVFQYRGEDRRSSEPADLFDGIARPGEPSSGGLLHARGANLRTLRFLAKGTDGELGCYDLDGDLKLRRVKDEGGAVWMRQNTAIPTNVFTVDAASVLYVDDDGRRWRLPKGDLGFDKPGVLGEARVCREVCTERDLFNVHGAFYELPAENAGGFAKIRPIATHNRRIHDFASYRGLLVLSGVSDEAAGSATRIIRSDDGRCALWVGVVDDLWRFGKPRGTGGPWKESAVEPGQPSDPYLMTGYDRKTLTLAHDAPGPVRLTLEADITGDAHWVPYRVFEVPQGQWVTHSFPDAFTAYWVRLTADKSCKATGQFVYE